MSRSIVVFAVVLSGLPVMVRAQPAPPGTIQIRGQVGMMGLVMPGPDAADLRSRIQVEATADPYPWLRLRLDGEVDTLVADRAARVNDAAVRARDVWAEFRSTRAELRVGYGRLIWGRLDEVMPSDVLNPIDSSRYFLEGRSEARLPIMFARGRVFAGEATTIEAVISLPGRRGRFDQLDEASSPFNLTRDLVFPAATGLLERQEPEASWANLQAGGRFSTTIGTVDMSVSMYRGFDSFGSVTFEPTAAVVGRLVERYSRFTMVAADAETVVGEWAVRFEGAYRTGEAIDAGFGLDRTFGDARLFGSVVWHRDWDPSGRRADNHDLNLIASVEQRFSRERYMARVFVVVNPIDASSFVRGLAAWSWSDNVGLEVSGGLLTGDDLSTDNLSRFRERDFVFARLRWLF